MNLKPGFSKEEESLMRKIAGRIIPASPENSLPGADDEEIFTRLYGNPADSLNVLLEALHELLESEGGLSKVSSWSKESLEEWITKHLNLWQTQPHRFLQLFVPLILRAYYKDDRVHSAYNRRPGPPFPQGYELSDGDWSLLDEVRNRDPFYRA